MTRIYIYIYLLLCEKKKKKKKSFGDLLILTYMQHFEVSVVIKYHRTFRYQFLALLMSYKVLPPPPPFSPLQKPKTASDQNNTL